MKTVTFIEKGQGRIFVFHKQHINFVKETIRCMDGFEYEYLPDDFITLYKDNPDDLIYTGKFGIDIPTLIQACAELKIGIMCRTKQPKIFIEV